MRPPKKGALKLPDDALRSCEPPQAKVGDGLFLAGSTGALMQVLRRQTFARN